MDTSLHRVIGIDLGTTYSAVSAFCRDTEEAVVIRTEAGEPIVPSVVSLISDPPRAIVGREAKANLPVCPEQTIIEIKREMGETFSQTTLAQYRERAEQQGVQPRTYSADGPEGSGREGDPFVTLLGGEHYTPQEISALVLMKVASVAKARIGEEIVDAVITVPAYFTERQRSATREAALLAGLYPRQLIPEPTAAAICYGLDRYEPNRKAYLVYDLGGGTFDVSIITVQESDVSVVSTAGNARLGGGDFDNAITDWAVAQLRGQHGVDVENMPAARAKIKQHAEMAKQALSTFEEADLPLGDVFDPGTSAPPALKLTRKVFESLIEGYLKDSLECVDGALAQAQEDQGLGRDDIDAILMVGGSSRIPLVKAKLLSYFERDEEFIRDDLNPDEVVARGAASLATRYQPTDPPFEIARSDEGLAEAEVDELGLTVRHVVEQSLGIAVAGGGFSRIISRGTQLPVSQREEGYTNTGPVEVIPVHVHQGDSDMAYENDLIGIVKIGPMEPKPAGSHQFVVTFTLDENGLLSAVVDHINEQKSYRAEFEQKASLGATEALSARRDHLLTLFAPQAPAAAPTARPPATPMSGAAPEPGAPAGAVPTPTQETPPAAQIPPAPVPGTPEAGAPAPDPGPQPQQPDHTAESAQLVELTTDPPGKMETILRRSKKLILKSGDEELAQAYNALVRSLNHGDPEESIDDRWDKLEDAYHDARTR